MTEQPGPTTQLRTTAILCLLVSGCVIPSTMVTGIDDPPWLSPYQRPLNSGPPRVQAGRPEGNFPDSAPGNGSLEPLRPDIGESESTPPDNTARRAPGTLEEPSQPDSTPQRDEQVPARREPSSVDDTSKGDGSESRESDSPQDPNREAGPSFPGQDRRDPVEISISAPETVALRRDVTFRIELRNTTSDSMRDVRFECAFDEGFEFSSKSEKRVARTFALLEAGERKSFQLTLVPVEQGRLCCRFSIVSDGVEAIGKDVCVEVTEEQVTIDILSPLHRRVGAHAEMLFKVMNLTERPLEDAVLDIRSEIALRPKEWSQGAEQAGDTLQWKLGTIQPGESVQVQIEFECQRASNESRVMAELKSAGQAARLASLGLKVDSRNDALRLEFADARDPIRRGESTEFALTIRNVGLQAWDRTAVEMEIPALWETGEAEATVNGKTAPIQVEKSENGLRMIHAESLPVDAVLTIRLPARATESGVSRMTAVVSTSGTPEAVTIDETTLVNP